MKKFISSIIDIRKGELGLTLLMFTNYYLILVTYYFLKPARDSLFLIKVSPEMLPLVFIITALVTAPVVTIYSKASRTLKLNHLINITIAVIIVNLFILRWLIQINQPWVYYLFYTWVSIYGALTTSQFWLLANATYDAAQAKRIFTLLGLGGIIGAFTGGQVTSIVIQKLNVSTENLLFFCMGFLAISSVLVTFIWKMKAKTETGQRKNVKQRETPKDKLSQITKTIFRSKHLTLTVGVIAMTMMVASFVDFQFKTVSFQAFSDKAELTAFLGKFYSWLSLVSLVLQLLFAYRLIRLLGVGGIIMFLPFGLLLGSATMFMWPVLISAIILRGADGSLKYSLDKTGRELLFLPIPLAIKKRTKIFIDMFVDRWFRGFAGGLLLLCTLVLKLTIQQISLVVIGMLIIWLVLTFLMRKEYVNSFRKAIERRTIDPGELRINIDDSITVKALLASLESGNERRICYALEMLKTAKGKKVAAPIKPLLGHESADVRRISVELLTKHKDKSFKADIEKMIEDSNLDVRREAIHFICQLDQDNAIAKLQGYLRHTDMGVRHAAIACIAQHGNKAEKPLIDKEIIDSVMSDESPKAVDGRVHLAKVLGVINNPDFDSYLDILLHDSDVRVIKASIECIGLLKKRTYIPWLMDHLTDKNLRTNVRRALAVYGTGIIGTLCDYLEDRNVSFTIRKNIPRVMMHIPQQDTVDALTLMFERVEPALKYYLLKALNHLRAKYTNLKFDKTALETILIDETRAYYETYQILYSRRDFMDTPGSQLLKKALEEKQHVNLERIFRIMGLVYPPKDIFFAYQGFVSGKKTLQANAIEFLDNLLGRDVKRFVLPIIDDLPVDVVMRKGQELFKINTRSSEEAVLNLINGKDTWLKCCAIYSTLDMESPVLREKVILLKDDLDPIVSETANLVVQNGGSIKT
jgi:ATP:ADP antiporter, AAA family